MFRLFKAELKKIFMKPSIFVVTGLIILMLALSFFLYNPSEKKNYLDAYTGGLQSGSTVGDYYNKFYLDESSGIPAQAKRNLDEAQNYANFYMNFDDETDGIGYLQSEWSEIQDYYNEYKDVYLRNKSQLSEYRKNLKSKIEDFSTTYKQKAGNSNYIYFLVKDDVDDSINDYLNNLSYFFERVSSLPGSEADIKLISDLIPSSGIFDTKTKKGKMSAALNSFIKFAPDKNYVSSLQTYIDTANSRLEEQSKTINSYNSENSLVRKTDEFRTYLSNYVLTSKYAKNIVEYGIQEKGYSTISNAELKKYKNCKNINTYQLKIDYTQTKYLFDNQEYDYNYATPFSLSEVSNTTINGYDYSYYALRLCSLFITVYLVVLAAGTIAGEQSAGTLKLMAIRPYSRSKLLIGKSLATFAIGGILLLVSAVASLVIGLASYGLESANIMAVFNATDVVILSPIVLYLIAFFTMYLEILFYASLAIFISTAFKSNVGAVSVSTLIFFVSLIINGTTTGVAALGFLPFTNISFFKYFGSAFLQTKSQSIIAMILSPGTFIDSTFWSSFVIYLISVAVLIYIPHLVFRNRDLK